MVHHYMFVAGPNKRGSFRGALALGCAEIPIRTSLSIAVPNSVMTRIISSLDLAYRYPQVVDRTGLLIWYNTDRKY